MQRREFFARTNEIKDLALPQVPATYRYLLHQLQQNCSNASCNYAEKSAPKQHTGVSIWALLAGSGTDDRLSLP
jgi:hypothetical protein